jgi:hypothetical protein
MSLRRTVSCGDERALIDTLAALGVLWNRRLDPDEGLLTVCCGCSTTRQASGFRWLGDLVATYKRV